MTEQQIIQFVIALIAPFFVAYGLGYFIRRSIKFIALLFGMFFFITGVMWYAGVIQDFSAVENWVTGAMKTGYDKTAELTTDLNKTVDAKKEGSNAQMNIIVGVSSFFTGILFGLFGGHSKRGVRLITD